MIQIQEEIANMIYPKDDMPLTQPPLDELSERQTHDMLAIGLEESE